MWNGQLTFETLTFLATAGAGDRPDHENSCYERLSAQHRHVRILFERFLAPELDRPPHVDVDVESDLRD